jgi:hypothetical protein
MRAPDGSYEDGFIAPGGEKLPARTMQPGNLERNNPLSLHDEVRTPFSRSDEARWEIDSGSALEPMERVVCSSRVA